MKLRNPWLIRLAAWAAAVLIRLWLVTLRVRVYSAGQQDHPTDPREERFIYAFWHETLLAPVKMRANVCVMISHSADGEFIAQVCRHLGVGVVRGSTTRGGVTGLLDMIRHGGTDHLVLTPDGPRGPRRIVQAGILLLASRSGLPILPVGVGYSRAWRAGSWDRFALPYPFSTVTGFLGEPIPITPDLDRRGLEHERQRVEAAMLSATDAAERWAANLDAVGHCSAETVRSVGEGPVARSMVTGNEIQTPVL
jgi:lysophospholipid acyltransferase (LPLAT)-like uncharacterized protein